MKIWFKTQTFSRFVRGSRGFTLSELAVVLAVTGILASIAVPNYLGSRNNSFDKDAQASIDVVLQAAKMHYQTYGDFSDGVTTQCGDTSVLAADLQRLEPGIDVVVGTVASTNSRVVSVQAVSTWNSGNESLGCQGFYAVALSSSGSCWAARFTVEGKYLATGSVSPIVLATEANTNNSEITPLSNTAVNGLAYAALKPMTSGADGTNSNGIAAIAAACKAKAHSTGIATVSGSYIAPSQFYPTWRDVASGGTITNNPGPDISLSPSSESRTQFVAMTGYSITASGTQVTSYSISPSAPNGTSFSTTTGLLSGTPTTVQSATVYTITGRNLYGSSTATFTLTVLAASPGTPRITSRVYGDNQVTVTVAAGTGGTPSSFTVSASPQVSGETRTCTVTGSSGSCIVTGLTNGVAYTFTAIASNDTATSSASSASASTTPYSVAGRAAAELAAAGEGTLWTMRTAPATSYGEEFSSVAYGNGVWVAVGRNSAMTSTDGVTWTALSGDWGGDNGYWTSITYGGGRWVAVSDRYRARTSTDLVNWTITAPSSSRQQSWSEVTYGLADADGNNGLFVAVGWTGTYQTDARTIMTSPDGETWTAQTAPNLRSWSSVAYGNGLFVAVSSTQYDNLTSVITSPDGVTWTERTTPYAYWQSVAYENGIFVAVGGGYGSSRVMTSSDGVAWTGRILSFDAALLSVVYGDGVWVAVSDSGIRVLTSPDAITWTAQSSASDSAFWKSVAYNGSKLVAVGQSEGGRSGYLPYDSVMTG